MTVSRNKSLAQPFMTIEGFTELFYEFQKSARVLNLEFDFLKRQPTKKTFRLFAKLDAIALRNCDKYFVQNQVLRDFEPHLDGIHAHSIWLYFIELYAETRETTREADEIRNIGTQNAQLKYGEGTPSGEMSGLLNMIPPNILQSVQGMVTESMMSGNGIQDVVQNLMKDNTLSKALEGVSEQEGWLKKMSEMMETNPELARIQSMIQKAFDGENSTPEFRTPAASDKEDPVPEDPEITEPAHAPSDDSELD